MAVGGIFAAIGAINGVGSGVDPSCVATGLLGGVAFGVGVSAVGGRLIVDGVGIEKRTILGREFRISWDEIESWYVHRGDVQKVPGTARWLVSSA